MCAQTPLALQAINITNAGANQCIHLPNQHISRCTFLTENDMQHSASSVDTEMWMIQQLAGTMPLTPDMCRKLMQLNGDDIDSEKLKSNSRWLMPRAICGKSNVSTNNIVKEPYTTYLMDQYQELFNPHYKEDSNTFTTSIADKACFFEKMALALEHNVVHTHDLEDAVKGLVGEGRQNSSSHATFCTATAAKAYTYIPAFVRANLNTADRTTYTNSTGSNQYLDQCMSKQIDWDKMPVRHASTGCVYTDHSITGQDTSVKFVYDFLVKLGLPPNTLMQHTGLRVFQEKTCELKDVLAYSALEGTIHRLTGDNYAQSHLVLPWMRNIHNQRAETGLCSSVYAISPASRDMETRDPRVGCAVLETHVEVFR